MKKSIPTFQAIAFCFMIIASSQLVAQIGIGVTGAVNSSAAGFLNMAFGIFKNGVLLPESVFLTTNSATATTGGCILLSMLPHRLWHLTISICG